MTRFFVHGLLGVAAAGFLSLAAANDGQISADRVAQLAPESAVPQRVEAIPLVSQPAEVIVPPAQHHVAVAPLAGRVTAITVAVGDVLTAGQEVARIYSPELLEYQRDFLLAQAALEHMQHVYEREKALASDGIISERRLDEAEHDVLEHRTAYDSIRRMLLGLGMSAEDLNALNDSAALQPTLAIRAAVDGTVTKELVDLGAGVTAGDVLFAYADTRKLWLQVHMDAVYLSDVKIGQPITAADCTAIVRRVSQVLDPQSQTLLLSAELSHGCSLRAGQQLAAQLMQSMASSYKVPAAAVFNSDGRDWVFALAEGAATAQPVTLVGEDQSARYLRFEGAVPAAIASSKLADLKAAWLGMGGE